MDFMKWGYLVRKIQVHTHWVYTFIGKDGYTYIITPMTGGNKVTVLYQNNIIHKFIDVFQTSHMIFNRYIETNIPGDYTSIHYHNKSPNLLTASKYKSPLNLTPTPSKMWLNIYQSVWNLAMIIISSKPVRNKWFNTCEKILNHILRVGFYDLIDTGLKLESIHCDQEGRDFNMILLNNSLMYRDNYIGLFYALKSNLVLNSPSARIAISLAHTPTRQFTLHKNILFNQNTTLTKFLDWTEPNMIHLMRENYLDDLIPIFNVQVWNIDIPLNSHIKIHKYGRFTITPKSYSTLAGSGNHKNKPLIKSHPHRSRQFRSSTDLRK